MRIREAVEKNYNALPGYKLVGYMEIAIPVFQRRLQVLVLSQKSIPVVEQFLLSFYKEGLQLDDIKGILGLTQQLIDEAWAGLIQKDYINNFTKTITEAGLKYLEENKIEKLEKKELQISIDGLTGEITKVNNQYMMQKDVKEKEIKALKSNYNKIQIEDIDFQSVKKVYKSYKQIDNENYTGDILDIIEVNGNTTRYRRVDVLFFQNNKNDLRILAYDDYNKVEEYEEKLLALENEGTSILVYNIDDFIKAAQVKDINELIKNASINECELIAQENINNEWDKYLNHNLDDKLIITPLISKCKLNRAFRECIEAQIKDNVKVQYIVAGMDFANEYQKNNCIFLQELSRFENFNFQQIPCYINKFIANLSKSEAIISIYEQNEIISNGSKFGLTEKVYKIKDGLFLSIYNKVLAIADSYKIPKLDDSFIDNKKLRERIEAIINLAKDCDSYMYNIDNIGWFGDSGIPDIKRLSDVPIAKNSENFKMFFDCFNKSFVESLEQNAKNKGNKRYFWEEFKTRYTELQKILEKIKTYRNKSFHLVLTEANRNKYYNYLQEDLNGYLPEFVDNGYIIIQQKVLLGLEEEIKKVLIRLRD